MAVEMMYAWLALWGRGVSCVLRGPCERAASARLVCARSRRWHARAVREGCVAVMRWYPCIPGTRCPSCRWRECARRTYHMARMALCARCPPSRIECKSYNERGGRGRARFRVNCGLHLLSRARRVANTRAGEIDDVGRALHTIWRAMSRVVPHPVRCVCRRRRTYG